MLPLKLFIAPSRLGLWRMHQYAKPEFLPLLSTRNRSVYSKSMSYMILQMKHIPTEVMDGFQEGLFVSKFTEGNFNSMSLKPPINKALKGAGGTIELTFKGHALTSWFLASPATAKNPMQFHHNVYIQNRNASSFAHSSSKICSSTRI